MEGMKVERKLGTKERCKKMIEERKDARNEGKKGKMKQKEENKRMTGRKGRM